MGNCAHKIQKHSSLNHKTQTTHSYNRAITAKSTSNDNYENF